MVDSVGADVEVGCRVELAAVVELAREELDAEDGKR
jgi:hypothetical protein